MEKIKDTFSRLDKKIDEIVEGDFVQKMLKMYNFTQIFLVGCAAIGLYRYYLVYDLGTTPECLFVTITALVLLYIALNALWIGHATNPGYIKAGDMKGDNEFANVCKRCEAMRPDEHAHHCSTCRKCCLDMDHHCSLMDNCIGKHTLRYFVQYCSWLLAYLYFSAGVIVKGWYYQNAAHGLGVKSIWEVRPDKMIYHLVMHMTNPMASLHVNSYLQGKVDKAEFMGLIDSFLIITVYCFICVIGYLLL
jgi:hypothetical protein